MIAQKVGELKIEDSEHKLVIDALKEVNDPKRKQVKTLKQAVLASEDEFVQNNNFFFLFFF